MNTINPGMLWKVAAASLALVPGLYSIIYYMVEAKVAHIDHRLTYLETESNKGPRFTQHDGELLSLRIAEQADLHKLDVRDISKSMEKIRFDDATCKANIGALTTRLVRVEDRLYANDLVPEHKYFRDSPYKLPYGHYDNFTLTKGFN